MTYSVDFSVVARADVLGVPRYAGRQGKVSPLHRAIRDTLDSGNALRVCPIDGETLRHLQQRVAAMASHVARAMNARARSATSADRISIYVWLEPKETRQADAGTSTRLSTAAR